MPSPQAPPVALAPEVRQQLESLHRASSTPQGLAFRCRLILRLAEEDHPANLHAAADCFCSRNTVALWRTRFLAHGLAGLQDAPRPGRPRAFSPGPAR